MKTSIRELQAGVPKGGTINQALVKLSSADYDYDWGTPSGGGGASTVLALAGNTLTGGTFPQPISFGDGVGLNQFKPWSGLPVLTSNMGTTTIQKQTYTFTVLANEVILVDTLHVWVDSASGTYSDQMKLSIQTVSGGNPTGVVLGSYTFSPINSPSEQGGSMGLILELTAGTYAFVAERTGAPDNVNFWVLGTNNYGGTNTAPFSYNGSSWIVSDRQPNMVLIYTFAQDTAYLSAPSSGNRLESVIVSSGGGNPYRDIIPVILQHANGWVSQDSAIGGTVTVAVSGTVPGMGSFPLAPTSKYVAQHSDGTILAGSSGNIVGRSLLTDTMLIIPS